MKAVVIREFGGPEVMRLEEVPTPVPGPGEVVIRVHAVSVNRTLDLVVRSGKYAVPVTLPIPAGVDFPAATVVARHAPTAFSMLRDDAKLKAGEWILVMGAAGGLGAAGIQVAKYTGAKA